ARNHVLWLRSGNISADQPNHGAAILLGEGSYAGRRTRRGSRHGSCKGHNQEEGHRRFHVLAFWASKLATRSSASFVRSPHLPRSFSLRFLPVPCPSSDPFPGSKQA